MGIIKDVEVVDLTVHEDDRGSLLEYARWMDDDDSQNESHSLVHKFGQVYTVTNPRADVVRAFHCHKVMWDWYSIIAGRALVVLATDNVGGQPTVMRLVMSARKPQLLQIPPGVWHGWMSLDNNTTLLSIASECYDREKPDEERKPWDWMGKDIWRVQNK